jgi:hypothetical protein
VIRSRFFALPIAFFCATIGAYTASGQTSELASLTVEASTGGRTSDLNLFSSVPSFSSSLPDAPSAFAETQAPQAPAATQQTTPPPNETEAQRKAREKAESDAQVQREVHQRNFGVLPNFNTVIGGRVPPLSPGQKFDLVFHTAIDPYTFTIAFIVAGFGEAEDTDQGYGWGSDGYFKRVGAAYADTVDGALIGNAILPVILRQDPRYFRKGTGSIKRRIIYSALSTVICRGDNGKRQFNLSNVAGNFLAGEVSNLYYPQDQRGTSLAAENALTVTAEGAVGAQILEFAPDITAYIHKRREHHRLMLQQQRDQQQGILPPAATPPPTQHE